MTEKDFSPLLSDIKLTALDLDGTLLTTDKQLTVRTRNALRNAAEHGIIPVFVTGRPYSGLPEELLDIPGCRYAITSNGAVTTDILTGAVMRASVLNPETAAQIAQIPLERGLLYNIFIDGIGYSDYSTFEQLVNRFSGTPLEKYVLQSRRGTDDILDFIKKSGDSAENIWIMCSDTCERDEIHDMILKYPSVRTVLTAKTDIEVGAQDADKGLALKEFAGMLHIPEKNILAIGDNMNDLGMLKAAGTAVVMGNAPEEVRQYSDIIADSNDCDGAAKILEMITQSP